MDLRKNAIRAFARAAILRQEGSDLAVLQEQYQDPEAAIHPFAAWLLGTGLHIQNTNWLISGTRDFCATEVAIAASQIMNEMVDSEKIDHDVLERVAALGVLPSRLPFNATCDAAKFAAAQIDGAGPWIIAWRDDTMAHRILAGIEVTTDYLLSSPGAVNIVRGMFAAIKLGLTPPIKREKRFAFLILFAEWAKFTGLPSAQGWIAVLWDELGISEEELTADQTQELAVVFSHIGEKMGREVMEFKSPTLQRHALFLWVLGFFETKSDLLMAQGLEAVTKTYHSATHPVLRRAAYVAGLKIENELALPPRGPFCFHLIPNSEKPRECSYDECLAAHQDRVI